MTTGAITIGAITAAVVMVILAVEAVVILVVGILAAVVVVVAEKNKLRRIMFVNVRYTLGLLLLLLVSSVWADVAIPDLSRRVTDLTTTLTAEQITALEIKLADFEAKKGSQLAVLILPTTQPEAIEAFGIRVADTWKIGRKNVDDGAILIVAKDDRKLRLEVGRGLEGVIPDAIAKRVLAETIKPHFKTDDYAGGIDAGVTQIIALIDGEPLPPASETIESSDGFDTFLIILFFCCIVLDLLFSSLFGNGLGTVLASLSIGGVSAAVASFLVLDIWIAVIIGVVMFIVLKIFYSSGGSIGGGSWGSSSSSWSGGGGSFGGGGASDSW
ncbi:MAG: TPM domain-containing protein [Methylococcales bacterium]|nr:TPM domain-containing protein [Methylococcales bacterium]